MAEYVNEQIARQQFSVHRERFGTDPMVTVFTWYGDSGSRSGLSLYEENLVKLRDTINEYLEGKVD